jgi:hypothetical protein
VDISTPSTPPRDATLMSSPRRNTLKDQLGEFVRLLTGWILAFVMLIPALIITLADKITMWRIRRRGGIN